MDFMSDQLFDGRRIRILTIVDAFAGCRRRLMCDKATAARTWWRPWSGHSGARQALDYTSVQSARVPLQGVGSVGLP